MNMQHSPRLPSPAFVTQLTTCTTACEVAIWVDVYFALFAPTTGSKDHIHWLQILSANREAPPIVRLACFAYLLARGIQTRHSGLHAELPFVAMRCQMDIPFPNARNSIAAANTGVVEILKVSESDTNKASDRWLREFKLPGVALEGSLAVWVAQLHAVAFVDCCRAHYAARDVPGTKAFGMCVVCGNGCALWCGACRGVRYCGPRCRLVDRALHATRCAAMKRLRARLFALLIFRRI